MTARLLLAFLPFAWACTDLEDSSKGGEDGDAADVDSDGDGLSDAEEETMGTDPSSADSDGDGLSDKEEVEVGSDPTLADTDGDSYLDAWEVAEGTDPADPESRIYKGYWPYNPDKDSVTAPTWEDGSYTEDSQLPRFAFVDQFGDYLDIYDLSGQGKPVMIDLSAEWCYYCQEMAKWIEGENSFFSDYYSSEDWYTAIPEAVANGDLLWVTVLGENNRGNQPTGSTSQNWYEDFSYDPVPVLADESQELVEFIHPPGYPTVTLFDENLVITAKNARNYLSVFSDYVTMYP